MAIRAPDGANNETHNVMSRKMLMLLMLRDLLPSAQPEVQRIYVDQPSLLLPHASFNAAVKFWINGKTRWHLISFKL